MNRDASSGIEVDAAVGATVPIVRRIVGALLIGSVLSAAVALAILLVPAALSLAVFTYLLTLHPTAAGRVYAAYGGV